MSVIPAAILYSTETSYTLNCYYRLGLLLLEDEVGASIFHPSYIPTTSIEFSSFLAVLNSNGVININSNPCGNSNWYFWLLTSGSVIIVLVIGLRLFV